MLPRTHTDLLSETGGGEGGGVRQRWGLCPVSSHATTPAPKANVQTQYRAEADDVTSVVPPRGPRGSTPSPHPPPSTDCCTLTSASALFFDATKLKVAWKFHIMRSFTTVTTRECVCVYYISASGHMTGHREAQMSVPTCQQIITAARNGGSVLHQERLILK